MCQILKNPCDYIKQFKQYMFTSIQCRIISFYFNPSFDLTSRDQHIAFETLPLSFFSTVSQHLYKSIRSWDVEHFKPLGTVHNNNFLWQWRENKICLKKFVRVIVLFPLRRISQQGHLVRRGRGSFSLNGGTDESNTQWADTRHATTTTCHQNGNKSSHRN